MKIDIPPHVSPNNTWRRGEGSKKSKTVSRIIWMAPYSFFVIGKKADRKIMVKLSAEFWRNLFPCFNIFFLINVEKVQKRNSILFPLSF